LPCRRATRSWFREAIEEAVKALPKLVLALILPTSCAVAQVAPAATGPRGLPFTKSVQYTFRYAQTQEFGSAEPDWTTSTFSGSADYSSGSERHPFALNYAGGYTWTLTGPDYATGLFQHLLLSQSIIRRKWNISVSDDASYRPQAPITGFSGIPGIGEPIGSEPPPSSPSDQSILTLNTHVVDNIVHGQFERNLNHALLLNAGGSSEVLRYPDGNGLSTDTQMANAGVTWRLNALNSLSATYMYSQFGYPDDNFSFRSNSMLFGMARQWNRRISTTISAGPQWTGSAGAIVPASLGVEASALASYSTRSGSVALSYDRATSGGSGYLFGDESDNASAHITRNLGRNLTVGSEVSYTRVAGLQNNGVTTSMIAGGEVSRRFGSAVSVFANYTATKQSTSSTLPGNTLNGLLQTVGFGISYSPRETRHR